jgi:hypothetical protein
MTIRGILLGTAALALLATPAMAAATNDTNQRLDQLEQMVQQQNQEIEQLKAEDNNEVDADQQNEAVQSQIQVLHDEVDNVAASDKDAWWHDTKVSGRMYFDISDLEQKTNGSDVAKQKGVGFDLKRFYVGIDHKFNDIFAANITTDVLYDGNAMQLYVKKAYLEANVDPALDIRVGSSDMPWIPFAEGVYGYRYVENTLIDRVKLGNSADWGAYVQGKFADGMFGYEVAVVNGAGYKTPPGAGNALKFKTVDFEGRVNASIDHFTVAVGGYDGKLGKDQQGLTTYHTATRFNALAAYTDDQIRAGVEYFSANNFLSVNNTYTDKDTGWSGFASFKFDPQWAVFGRYDWVEEKTTNPSIVKPRDGYYNVGIEWTPVKIVSLSLVYKHDSEEHGALSQQNGSGTLGSASLGSKGTYNEVGLFGIFQW